MSGLFKTCSIITALFVCGPQLHAQEPQTTPTDISKMVREVDASRIERTVRILVGFGTRNTLSSQTDPKRGIGAARDWLFSELKSIASDSGGRLSVSLQTFTQPPMARIPKPTVLSNVIATLKPTSDMDDRVLVVSGHYDSMPTSPTDPDSDAPGANDDASGTAAVLEMARVMSKHAFPIKIVFMTVPGEEQGLLGAAYFAEQAKLSKTNIAAMITNDIIGNTTGGNGIRDDHTVRLFSEGVPSGETTAEAATRKSVGGENDSPSRQLARFIQESAGRFVKGFKVKLISRRDRYGRGGDHIPFVERGFAGVRFTEPNEDYTHQHQNVREENGIKYGDLPEFVDFAYVANVTRVNLAALASMAIAPPPPTNVRILTSKLTNDTDLAWSPGVGLPVKDYEAVWRDTEQSRWSSSKVVGQLTKWTAKGMSKDNYLFGVRSVGSNGMKSVVVYPKPGR